jgi:uncharacterized MAPEG superfamily protein
MQWLMQMQIFLLVWSAALLGLYLGPQSILYRLEYGIKFAASGRDGEGPPKSVHLQRSEKALRNFLETYGVFIALSAAAALGQHSNSMTQWGGATYFAARIVYVPLYIFGVPFGRSAVWIVSVAGLAAMFFGLAF